jgi:cobaltochelatase CobS
MSAQEIVLCKTADIEAACIKAGLPVKGASKAGLAQALAGLGWTAAQVRTAGGAGPSKDDLAILESRVNGHIDDMTKQLNLRLKNQAYEVSELTTRVSGAVHDCIEADAAAKAAGAVAARAEALALKGGGAAVDPGAIAAAVKAAVQAAVEPINAALAVADPGTVERVLSVVAGPVRQDSCLNIFGIDLLDRKGSPVMVDLWDNASAPAVDPCYIWSETLLSHLILSQNTGENLWLGGPKGTGKSEAAKQFAARTGRPFTRINFTKHTALEDFFGALGLVNGATEFVEGDFLMAYASPGSIILLDEPTNADPGNLAVLNGLLEPGARVNLGGAVRSRAAGVLVLGADNTLGHGDDSGRYAGTRLMNSSLLDRFARVLPMTYLPESVEVDAVVKHTGCSVKLAKHVVQCINHARAKVETGDIVDAPSLRQIVAFVRALQGISVDDAWSSTIASKQPAESAVAMAAIKAACLNNQTIEGELSC